MTVFQPEKAVVRACSADLATATPETLTGTLSRHTDASWHWRGRRPGIFKAGQSKLHGFSRVWVVAMGHLMCLFDRHLYRMAEGHFGGFMGWANLTLCTNGGGMGMAASPGMADRRGVDLYREQDDKRAENRIFIDILHALNLQGLDVPDQMAKLDPGQQPGSARPLKSLPNTL